MPKTFADFANLALHAGESSEIDLALQQWWKLYGVESSVDAATNAIAVAFSGGADSTAILLGVLRLFLRLRAQKTGQSQAKRVLALHVHHGLQAEADHFANHCRQMCQSLSAAVQQHGVELQYVQLHVQVDCAKGASIEAQARLMRYAALAQAAQDVQAQIVLLGHHAGDQVESVLLALSRGAGVAGIAGMPVHFERNGMSFARPLLRLGQKTLKNWLQQHHVPWVEDPSNIDQRFTRNRLRHTVLPLLDTHLPGFSRSMARSAELAAQADVLQQDLAEIDMQVTGCPPQIAALQQLSRARQANLVRHWLKKTHGMVGSESQVAALLDVLAACTTRGHRIHIKMGSGFVERNGAELAWRPLQS